MTPGTLVIFNGYLSAAEVLFFLQRGMKPPVCDKTVGCISWVGETAWEGNRRDMRLCCKLEEYGELDFPLAAWREASDEDLIRAGYYAEYTVVSSVLHPANP